MIKLAVKEAKKARHKQHRLGAVLMRGGKPIAASHNFAHVHAEHATLNRAWRSDTEGCTLFVARVRKDGSLGMAKPCKLCMERLVEAGIKKVTYSNKDGQLETIKLAKKHNGTSSALNYTFALPYRSGA